MNWKKGLKRIAFCLALVSAILVGLISTVEFVLEPYSHKKYRFDYIKSELAKPYTLNHEQAWFRLSDYNRMVLSSYSDLHLEYALAYRNWMIEQQVNAKARLQKAYEELREEDTMRRLNMKLELNQLRQEFWPQLSIPALAALCIVAALGGAAVGFGVAWIILRGGGFVIYKFIRWLVLGFVDEEAS